MDATDGNSRTYDTGCALVRGETAKFDVNHVPASVKTTGRMIVKALRSIDGRPVLRLAFNGQYATIWVARDNDWEKIDETLLLMETRAEKRKESAVRNYQKTHYL